MKHALLLAGSCEGLGLFVGITTFPHFVGTKYNALCRMAAFRAELHSFICIRSKCWEMKKFGVVFVEFLQINEVSVFTTK